jgi:hypothetical protein
MSAIVNDSDASSPNITLSGSKPHDVLTPEKLDSIIETAARCAEDPLFDDWVAAVEEYRRLHNTVPDAD